MKNQENAEKKQNTGQLINVEPNESKAIDEKNPIDSVEEKKEPTKHNDELDA